MSCADATVMFVHPGAPAGQLTRRGWRVVESAHAVIIDSGDAPAVAAAWRAELAAEGFTPQVGSFDTDGQTWVRNFAAHLKAEAPVAVISLTHRRHELAAMCAAGCGPEVHVEFSEVAPPAYAKVADFFAVMERIASPGGCPWAVEQTHESLAPYALEEVHEVLEAIAAGDRAGLREELGDLLMQVAFHAEVAAQHETEPFGIDEVAAGIAAKLRRRRPHLFDPAYAGDGANGVDETDAEWQRIKAAEKARESCLEGIALTLPGLARAEKIWHRATAAGLGAQTICGATEMPHVPGDAGEWLFAAACVLAQRGAAPEEELRAAIARAEDRIRAAERGPANTE